MGVSLERVQNKFACIIGELCSEPFILSQFAVWVDLRIAEYKTKGTISLDCSGDPPNPGWMKGVKNVPQRSGSNTVDTGQVANRRRGSYTSSPSIQMSPSASPMSNQMYNERLQSTDSRVPHINSGQQQSFETRLSPDIVVIKNEPSPPDQQSSCAFVRKRSADGTDLQSDYYSPSKSRRLTGPSSSALPSSAQESSSNQSLMSIINTESDSITLEPVESQDDIFKVTMDMQEELRKSQGLTASPSNSTFSPRRPTATATSSSSSPNNQSWLGSTGADAGQGTSSQAGYIVWECDTGTESEAGLGPQGDIGKRTRVVIDKMSVGMRRQRIVGRERKSMNTIKHQSAALLQIEGWLREHPRLDTRNVEDIQPEELDEYLAEYFTQGKKTNGTEFRATYFSRLRTNIERHLKEHGYPHSIVKSPVFARSQAAFKARYQMLCLIPDSSSINVTAMSNVDSYFFESKDPTIMPSFESSESSKNITESPNTESLESSNKPTIMPKVEVMPDFEVMPNVEHVESHKLDSKSVLLSSLQLVEKPAASNANKSNCESPSETYKTME